MVTYNIIIEAVFVELQGLGRAHCDGGGLPGAGSVCYRPNQQHHDDSRSVRSDDGDARPGSGSRSDLNDSHCGLGDDSDAGYSLQNIHTPLEKSFSKNVGWIFKF